MTERYVAKKFRLNKEACDAKHEGPGLEAKEYDHISTILKSLESLLPIVEDQLLIMEKGGGAILYPQPHN